jgi:hypothetical protein
MRAAEIQSRSVGFFLLRSEVGLFFVLAMTKV